MGYHKGLRELHGIRLRHRGVSAHLNAHSTRLILKQEGRVLWDERIDNRMTHEQIKAVIDSIKDYKIGRW